MHLSSQRFPETQTQEHPHDEEAIHPSSGASETGHPFKGTYNSSSIKTTELYTYFFLMF